ncbi:MAG: enoyl-CoA hydratase-related protein [Candidatus Wenzhouxiangella sp. M2_3B_020]
MLKIETNQQHVATLTLNRPDVHNAFNAELIAELSDTFDGIAADPPRVLVLTGAGKSFSAGADLEWMRSMAEAGEDANRRDAERLGAMFRKLDELPCPTVARVNGPAFGGGVGLVSCCDIAIAAEPALFGLTEVRLGLIPATIAPFVIARIGQANARRYMLTGERFDARRALAIGLVHECCEREELDEHYQSVVDGILAGGPTAVSECKQLVRRIARFDGTASELDGLTAEWIARLRVSPEGQEGLHAFLGKRRPAWTDGDD